MGGGRVQGGCRPADRGEPQRAAIRRRPADHRGAQGGAPATPSPRASSPRPRPASAWGRHPKQQTPNWLERSSNRPAPTGTRTRMPPQTVYSPAPGWRQSATPYSARRDPQRHARGSTCRTGQRRVVDRAQGRSLSWLGRWQRMRRPRACPRGGRGATEAGDRRPPQNWSSSITSTNSAVAAGSGRPAATARRTRPGARRHAPRPTAAPAMPRPPPPARCRAPGGPDPKSESCRTDRSRAGTPLPGTVGRMPRSRSPGLRRPDPGRCARRPGPDHRPTRAPRRPGARLRLRAARPGRPAPSRIRC